MPRRVVAFSVDVEDWPQSTIDRSLPIRAICVEEAEVIIEILANAGAKATFFVLGKVAEAFPGIVRAMHVAGHEIACHGYSHVEAFHQTHEEFKLDVRRAKDILENVVGSRVDGYRAPDFSIVPKTLGALRILAEMGFRYDSSIFPALRPRYGIEGWRRRPVRIAFPSGGELIEFPVGVGELGGKLFPVGGGGYFRVLPYWLSRNLIEEQVRDAPFVFYCHPYETNASDSCFQEMRIPWPLALHQGFGRRGVAKKLGRLLRDFACVGLRDVLETIGWIEESMFISSQPEWEPLNGPSRPVHSIL